MQQSLPLFSVVIPTYNHALFLTQALQSLLDQTCTNWEAIVVDNFSDDETEQVITQLDDSRIIYNKFANGGIIAASRNEGIKLARAQYIAFLDSDDSWFSGKLASVQAAISKSQADLFYHDLKIIYADDRPSRNLETRSLKQPILVDLLMSGNLIANSSVVVRKSVLEEIGLLSVKPEHLASEDYHTWLTLAAKGVKFNYINDLLGTYFIHPKGVSRKNMVPATRSAADEFLPVLSAAQRQIFDGNLDFMEGRHALVVDKHALARRALVRAVWRARFAVKVKALYSLVCQLHVKGMFKPQ